MKKQILAVATAALVSVMSFVPAFAQSGTVVITGGPKAVTVANVTFPPITLNGVDRDLTGDLVGVSTVYTMTDYAGTSLGWALQIAADPLTNGAGGTIPLTGFTLTVSDLTLVNIDGAPVEDLVNYFDEVLDLSTTQTVMVAPAGTGMGQYTFTPTFKLNVPATTRAGTFSSIINFTLIAAP